ncbi:hypothetical protein [Coraliomargarita akajimensis]|uniref:Neuromedin U n=1 Tax=Coraliomargarita akajimensis (strain DSM 45221 / IAM 15411 / JCM 23193 / KCTC 12865 / 04OKA010-24) TaxID=583355 RepID=D5EPX0_CORAD|nr:hypothetical protein [Coraliomargarita akajimensis]ADE55703.1 conserved hypothetical protein [Coraliomargarita akajimensis DSM 45221]
MNLVCRKSLLILLTAAKLSAQDTPLSDHDDFIETELAIDTEEMTLEEVSQQLENPLTSLWSLTFQNNLTLNTGEAVKGTQTSNTFLFQPALPIPVRDDMVFIARPVFPIVYGPELDPLVPSGVAETQTGFGDIQMLALLGPSRTEGAVWGLGLTTKFPTASDDALGQGKYQAGPAGMYFYLGEDWTLGLLAQHWNSFAGDGDREPTAQTDIQYVARYKLPGAMSIGMGPSIKINWQADSNDRLTLPIGLGITKTVRWGKTPIKLRIEPQYSIIKPDSYGETWNIRIQIAPVLKSPFAR